MRVEEILQKAVELNASDIFIVAGKCLCFKIKGSITPMSEDRLMPNDTEELIREIYTIRNNTNMNLDKVHENGEDDFSFSLSRLGRFRVSVYYQRGSLAAVLRVVRFILPDPEEYHIPRSVIDIANANKGMILVTGSAGSGKSTTLACMVDQINQTKNDHIITIEDPIEYLHTHKESIVSQREIGNDTKDYLHALKAALREAPNVILVGEILNYDTMQVALSAAETGHLVLSTLHTLSASETVNRIIDLFPANQQNQVRVQLSSCLQAVVCQRLVMGLDGNLYPAFEIMTVNSAIKTQIRENKLHLIDNTINTNRSNGMISMDDYLFKMVQDHIISKEEALKNANNPESLEKRI